MRKERKRLCSGALLGILAVVWVAPLLGVVYEASGPAANEVGRPYEFAPGIIRTLLISVFVCVVAAVLSCLFGAMAGYALSQKRFHGRRLLFGLVVGSMFFPPVAFMVPLFKVTVTLGIYDTLAALILPSAVTAFSIVYMKAAIDRIPSSVLDAAKIDGVGEVGLFTRIVVPLVRGPFAALFVLQFLSTWSALAVPMAVVESAPNYTLALRLALAIGRLEPVPKQELLWLVALIAIPVVLLFLLKARTIVSGVMAALFRYERLGADTS